MSKQKIYKKILQGLFFLSLISPLIVDRRIFFPYVTTSALFFRFVCELLFALWIVYVLNWRTSSPSFEEGAICSPLSQRGAHYPPLSQRGVRGDFSEEEIMKLDLTAGARSVNERVRKYGGVDKSYACEKSPRPAKSGTTPFVKGGKTPPIPRLAKAIRPPANTAGMPLVKGVKLNFLILSIFFYLFALTLSTIFSVNPYLSFWGDAERMMGLFGILHFFALFFVGINIFKGKKELNFLLNSFVAVSFIMCVYGILQKFGFTAIKPNIDRIVATVGNSGILAGYLIFGLFFSVYLYANIRETEHEKTRKLIFKIFYLISILLHLIAIFLTGTRGAYLGVAVGLLTIFILTALKSGNKSPHQYIGVGGKKITYSFILAGLFCILIYGILFINQNKNFVKNNSYLYRLTHFSLNDATLQMRLMSWKWGLKGAKEKPLLGYGLEQYAIPFNKNFEAKYYDYSPALTYFDRAHNVVIELLATTGIIGLLAYILLLASLVYFIIRRNEAVPCSCDDATDKIYYMYKAVFLGLVAAYFIQNLFIFDLLPQMLGFMVLLVFANGSFVRENWDVKVEETIKPPFSPFKKGETVSTAYEIFILIAIIILCYGIFYSSKEFIIKPYKALKDDVAGQIYFSIDKTEKGVEFLKKSLGYKTFLDLDLRSAAANTILDYYVKTGAEDKNKKNNIDYGINLYKENLQYLPNDAYYNYKMAEFLNYRFSIDLDEKIIDEAKYYINKAITESSENIRTYYLLSENMLMSGKLDEAVKTAGKTVEMNKNFSESYWELAKTYYIVQDFDKAKENLIKTINSGYKIGAENMEGFVHLFEINKSIENAMEYYELLVKNGTSNPLHYTTLANYLLQTGEKEKAIEYALKAAELDSKLKEQVDKFVKQVNHK